MSSAGLVDQYLLHRLTGQIERRQLSSTYLFTGPESEKNKQLAIAFAQALNCPRTERPEALPCGCTVCRRIEAGVHPDVMWYGTDEESNAIKISQVREFRSLLALKPFEGKVKVFIFNGAERLSSEAQNALLKSLEEPPRGNAIVLLVPQANVLFDTVVSRALEIKVPPFKTEEIRNILVEEGAAEKESEFLARMAQGKLARAREALQEGWFHTKNQWLDSLVKNPIAFLDQFGESSRGHISVVLAFLLEWLRDVLVFEVSGESEFLVHADRIRLIESYAERYPFDSVLELFERIEEIRKALRDYGNQKLALTQTQILWGKVVGNDPPPFILKKPDGGG
ncbi:MAG: hypothetical protein A3G87_07855 [Omnitrophica bacterium RIFCSPLOWO2_12_FULL_50_11]|nr:MAG: hypothetical protein A3G87_07855 [Omnitrophica bacterium RIFCSPLOWO2_12_FULL_50_11]